MTFVAVCKECGSVYPAEVTQQNTVHLVGGRNACGCGSSAFRFEGDDSPDESEVVV